MMMNNNNNNNKDCFVVVVLLMFVFPSFYLLVSGGKETDCFVDVNRGVDTDDCGNNETHPCLTIGAV